MNRYRLLSLIIAIICSLMVLSSAEEIQPVFDETVIEAINRIKRDWLSGVSEEHTVDKEMIADLDLTFENSYCVENMVIEQYRGKAGGLLALLTKGSTIYCAQYINEVPSESVESIDEVFHHTLVFDGRSGPYREIRVAFFSDGKSISYIYYSQDYSNPWRIVVEDNECILSLILANDQ